VSLWHINTADSDTKPLTNDGDFMWAYATVPGEVAYRGRMFRHLNDVVQSMNQKGETSTFEDVFGMTNQEMIAEGLAQTMIKQNTLRGRSFGPVEFVSH